MQVWVDYDTTHAMLNATIAPCCLSSKPSTPLLSVRYNLSSVLPTTAVFAGFSAATGPIDSRHYILGWSFKLNGQPNYSALSLKTIQQLAAQLHARPRTNNNITTLCAGLIPTLGIAILVVLQGTNSFAGESHPIHIHGDDFYILEEGFGNFDAAADTTKLNLDDPPMRNTVGVPVNGWAVIRRQPWGVADALPPRRPHHLGPRHGLPRRGAAVSPAPPPDLPLC
ncbi:hypothetical protein HU200_050068 [Digitaria exilis]|uniref:Plastocyanin-like domain-containing protein n=1 Tax=Digitaria exilis TaxID=1010633 RepID=A0A835AV97_9POAL|nr:hypothetical protein HU200_050068 [Digitaria exilis]